MYQHTQQSHVWMMVLAPIEAVVLLALIVTGAGIAALVGVMLVFGIVMVVGLVFSRLTVEVDGGAVRLAFGSGWPRKTIPLHQVTSAQRVRNRWWYGFGMRKIPGGWMWNVAGLDAVELTLATGKKFRVGTDQPDALLDALSGKVPIG